MPRARPFNAAKYRDDPRAIAKYLNIAEGNGYCGTMAMALVALKGLLPNLSGLILRSAEREAGWRATNDEGVGEVGRRKSDHQLAAVRR